MQNQMLLLRSAELKRNILRVKTRPRERNRNRKRRKRSTRRRNQRRSTEKIEGSKRKLKKRLTPLLQRRMTRKTKLILTYLIVLR